MQFSYEAPAAAEVFVRAQLLGYDSIAQVVRILQPGDRFAGFVKESEDRSGEPVGVLTHLSQVGTIAVGIGRLEMQPAVAVVPIWGAQCYAASPTTFSHNPLAGVFIGYLSGPWLDRPEWYIIDTSPAYYGDILNGAGADEFMVFSAFVPNIASASTTYLPVPVGGTISSIGLVHDNTLTASATTVSFALNDQISPSVPIVGGDIVIPFDADFGKYFGSVPTSANVVGAGHTVEIISDGGGSGSAAANVSILLMV